jgi:4-alpha-glucanotransferase
MLICGEDLGLVPACVPGVLRDLGVLSLRIQRMPPAGVQGPFDTPEAYPHAAVCAPSCHDVSTTRAWWAQDAARREAYAAAFLPGRLGVLFVG